MPPPPPPAMTSRGGGGGGATDRGALLKQIQQGKALKKAVTNDRSAPVIGGSKTSSSPATSPQGRSNGTIGGGSGGGGGGPAPRLPGIGGLFADGIPKLRPTAQGIATGRIKGTFVDEKAISLNIFL